MLISQAELGKERWGMLSSCLSSLVSEQIWSNQEKETEW